MKGKKCPYCGRRISYLTTFHEKKHGIYECSRCKKESKIKLNKMLLIAFAIVVLLVILYIILWLNSGAYNNILGIIPPVVVLIAFYFCTPLFIKFVPIKRFLDDNDRHIKRQKSEFEEAQPEEKFVFDKKIFDEIKNKRNSVSAVEEKIDRIIAEEDSYVPVIEDVSEAHTSSQQALKKLQKPQPPETEVVYEEEVKEYVPQRNKPDGSRYTANRKF